MAGNQKHVSDIWLLVRSIKNIIPVPRPLLKNGRRALAQTRCIDNTVPVVSESEGESVGMSCVGGEGVGRDRGFGYRRSYGHFVHLRLCFSLSSSL